MSTEKLTIKSTICRQTVKDGYVVHFSLFIFFFFLSFGGNYYRFPGRFLLSSSKNCYSTVFAFLKYLELFSPLIFLIHWFLNIPLPKKKFHFYITCYIPFDVKFWCPVASYCFFVFQPFPIWETLPWIKHLDLPVKLR